MDIEPDLKYAAINLCRVAVSSSDEDDTAFVDDINKNSADNSE